MHKSLYKDQRGLAPILLIAIAVVVIAAIGLAGWQVVNKKDDPIAKATKEAIAACNQSDKDLCKFLASWKENKYYTIKAASENDGQKSTYTMQSIGGDRTHMTSSGGGTDYEIITIGKTTYTKDAADGAWWKQTLPDTDTSNPSQDVDVDFKDPDENAPETDKTVYKKIGKEPCGNLTCFKYQVIDPTLKDETQYIWFDDDTYQLRRMSIEGSGSKSDMVFSYEKFTIEEPSPTKDMPSPDASGMPSEAEMQQLMQRYGGQ